jgi:hypothetical protein
LLNYKPVQFGDVCEYFPASEVEVVVDSWLDRMISLEVSFKKFVETLKGSTVIAKLFVGLKLPCTAGARAH